MNGMADQIVITEKTSQAKDIRDAVGHRYGTILPAEGHLFDLVEPEAADPAWKRWSATLLRPDGLYPTKPAAGGNKAPKLQAIRDALRTAKRVWLATDCDRERQLIGQEILEHYGYKGEVRRVMFTVQDAQIGTAEFYFGAIHPTPQDRTQQPRMGEAAYSWPTNGPASGSYQLDGTWLRQNEALVLRSGPGAVRARFSAAKFHLVAAAVQPATLRVTVDGGPAQAITVERPTLYTLFDSEAYGEHLLAFETETAGLSLFSVTFG